MGAGRFKSHGRTIFGVKNRNSSSAELQLNLFDNEDCHENVNPFNDKITWPSKIEEAKQGKHIEGYIPTSSGIIHHSKNGTHIVPAKPNKKKE